jgi:hypothetical protein
MEPTIVVNKRKKFELMNHSKNDFLWLIRKLKIFSGWQGIFLKYNAWFECLRCTTPLLVLLSKWATNGNSNYSGMDSSYRKARSRSMCPVRAPLNVRALVLLWIRGSA